MRIVRIRARPLVNRHSARGDAGRDVGRGGGAARARGPGRGGLIAWVGAARHEFENAAKGLLFSLRSKTRAGNVNRFSGKRGRFRSCPVVVAITRPLKRGNLPLVGDVIPHVEPKWMRMKRSLRLNVN